MIANLTQFFRQDSKYRPITDRAFAIDRQLKSLLKDILGKDFIAMRSIYWVDETKLYFTYALLSKRLDPEDVLLLHVDLERQFTNITDIRNLDHQLFIEWTI